jgi:enabled protein
MQCIAAKEDRDTVRALRAVYGSDFDSLEKRHDRYVQCKAPNYSQDDLDAEKDRIQAVIYDHLAISAKCDDYSAQTNSRSASVSRASSRHSSVSSRHAKIHEAERKEKEAQLMLQQVEDETRRREEEDAIIREAEDYKRKMESERRQREICDEIDLQRLSGAIMRQQLNDLTVDDQAVPTRTSSLVSGLSRISRTSSHHSLPNNATLLAQTPAASIKASTMTTAAPIIRIMATPQPQPSTVVISKVAQTIPMTTPLVGSTSRIPLPTRLFGQPAATMQSTPKVNLLGKLLKVFTPSSLTRSAFVPHILLNAGASNAFVTTSLKNAMFLTSSSTSVAAQPVTTSQTTSTVYNIVTPPTSVSQVPVSIIPPTTTPVTAPISTSAVPQAPTTTVLLFVSPTSTSVAIPVSSSAAHPFTPVTTATIYAPTTSNVTHVPVSVPLPPRSSASVPLPPGSSASVPFPPGSSASVPFPPGSSASTSSWFSS